ncbi:hypothetical protein CcaCcLH18_13897 [Colletotrichum camelliae]|nr:hypothetical protein CcaCcLH18_13897 [Colletotrichum camelliae]
MSAANEDRQQDACLDSPSYRERAWGSLFAQTVIESSTFTNGVAMQPENPNENQVATFNAYIRLIVDVCRTEVMKKDLAPHPRNTDETVTAQSEPTGGLPRFERLKEDMAKAMVAKDVPKMAEIFRQTCPGDWNRGYGAALGGMLNKVVNEGLLPPELSQQELDAVLVDMTRWMERLKEFWKLKCAQNEGVLLKRREWQKEIGL